MPSLNPAGTALARTLWTAGNRTPPFVRSPNVNRLSTTCALSGEKAQDQTKEPQTLGSCSGRPADAAPPSREPPPRCADKRPKEPLGATGVRRRSYTSTAVPVDQKSYLWARYNDMKRLVHGKRSRVPPHPRCLSACVPPRFDASPRLLCRMTDVCVHSILDSFGVCRPRSHVGQMAR